MPIKLNEKAFHYAKNLILEGKVIIDSAETWEEYKPNILRREEFIERQDMDEYANWFLGVDEEKDEESGERYRFPLGDFRALHRAALVDVKTRAKEQNYPDIENAATHLLELVGTGKEKED